MKKIIALFLCLGSFFIFGNIRAQAVENLESLSWEKISNNYKELFTSGDDLYLRKVIRYIDKKDDFDIEKDYLSSRNGLVYLEDTDYDTMCQKLQIIANTYNAANDIQIKIYTKLYEDEPTHMNITIYSSNYPATYVGQVVEIKNGALFYESSKNFGEGEYNTTFYIDCVGHGIERRSFIPKDYMVLVNGVSYLDDNGNIISSFYKPFDEIASQNIEIPIDSSQTYMLHICTNETDLGWVLPETLKAPA